MKTGRPTRAEWLQNFRLAVTELIKEHNDSGYTAKTIVMTEDVAEKLYEAQGKESNDFLGYKIEIADPEELLEDEVGVVFIEGDPIH